MVIVMRDSCALLPSLANNNLFSVFSILCDDCQAVPTDVCLREHLLCSVQRLAREAAQVVASVHDAVSADLQDAQESLRALRWVRADGLTRRGRQFSPHSH